MFSLAACGSSSESAADTSAAPAAASEAAEAVSEAADAASEAASEAAEAVSEAADAASEAASEAADAASEAVSEAADAAADADSDLAYVQDKGTLVVGITDFEPMDYMDESGNWIGFDADLATAFAESLGVSVEFQEIDWDNKILELDGKSVDCIWNGMTLTDEVTSAMDCTAPYLNNQQIVVVAADVADQYQDEASLADLSFAVESGSAGAAVAEEKGLDYTEVSNQANALMEVAAGTSGAAIIDSLMAAAMVGEGTSYEDLTTTVGLTDEEYGVGFRKGSDLAAAADQFFKDSYADGSIQTIAETYKVQGALIAQ
ncbi:MAG: transporter substrate-binding domain-containing protein [Eubacterium sp.]|nr:transporter substrate-binding domain-containing protein [Eubacterium sp.]